MAEKPSTASVERPEEAKKKPSEVPPTAPQPAAQPPVDPTRYGDWEKDGRCIDF